MAMGLPVARALAVDTASITPAARQEGSQRSGRAGMSRTTQTKRNLPEHQRREHLGVIRASSPQI